MHPSSRYQMYVRFVLFKIILFVETIRGTCSPVEILKGYMVRKTVGRWVFDNKWLGVADEMTGVCFRRLSTLLCMIWEVISVAKNKFCWKTCSAKGLHVSAGVWEGLVMGFATANAPMLICKPVTIVATSPVVLRWLCDSPRTGCARRTQYVCGVNKQ